MGNLPAVFLLDRPQQPSRFVEVCIIRPAVQGRKALLAPAGATAAIGDAVRVRAVPREANEESALVPEVRGPPVLRVGHKGPQILDHGLQVETLKLCREVERLAHRVVHESLRSSGLAPLRNLATRPICGKTRPVFDPPRGLNDL